MVFAGDKSEEQRERNQYCIFHFFENLDCEKALPFIGSTF
jgi:hypothetical protein